MDKIDLEKFVNIEQGVTFGLDMLEVAKCYCEKNCDKFAEIAILNTILEVMLTNQRKLVGELDDLLVC